MLSLSDYGVKSCIYIRDSSENGTLWAHFGTLIFGITGKRYTCSYFAILSETTYSKLPFEERLCAHTTY